MVTATQSAHKRELGARLGKRADHGLSGVLDTEKRSSTACQFECDKALVSYGTRKDGL
jgi:hypothetical protein